MFKILITTSTQHCDKPDAKAVAVHTVVVDFDTQKQAEEAANLVNASPHVLNRTNQKATLLFVPRPENS